MRTKLILSWDIKDESQTDYYEFVVNEFIPSLKRFGLSNIEFWYTIYGEVEQIQASAISSSEEEINNILGNDAWHNIEARLTDYVSDFTQKLIPATNGFQL